MKQKINEVTDSFSDGQYQGKLNITPRIWKKNQMGPFSEKVSKFENTELSHDSYDGDISKSKQESERLENLTKNGIKKTIQIRKKITKEDILKEDLAVWFGKKKKPKGSKQPKGPWVNICRKVNGKHPPCGRPDTDKGAYPKCRAAGVAGKMSDSAKRAACQQKRKAEKKDTQTGKGQKPIMTSYKPRKESVEPKTVRLTESDLYRLINKVLKIK